MTELELLNELIEIENQLSQTSDHKLRSEINIIKDKLREFPDKSSSSKILSKMIDTLNKLQSLHKKELEIRKKDIINRGLLIDKTKTPKTIHNTLKNILLNSDLIECDVKISYTRTRAHSMSDLRLENRFNSYLKLLQVIQKNPNLVSLKEFVESTKP